MYRVFLTVAIGFSLCISVWAKAPATEKNPPEKTLKQICQLLDRLEEKFPGEQATLFKIKALVHDLFKMGQAANRTDSPQTFSSESLARDEDGAANLYSGCNTLKEDSLRERLREIMSHQVPVGYQGAQKIIFEELDNHGGIVQCVYTGRELKTDHEPNATDMNIEHTWPQSQGAVGDAKCDLHHLFPTDSKANNLRGSYPFGTVERPTWEQGGSKFDGDEFEVRKEHRGNVARAKFYFAVRYDKKVPQTEEAVLRQWSQEDPVDQAEKDRNNRIENYQHNRNAFIDHPEFITAISDF